MIHKVIKSDGKAYFINACLWGGLFGRYTYHRITRIERNYFNEVVTWQRLYNPAIDKKPL